MKRSVTALTFTLLAMFTCLTFGFMGKYPAIGTGNLFSSVASATGATTQTSITLPNVNIYGLGPDSDIYVLTPGSSAFTKVGRLNQSQINGNLIGIDSRVADGSSTSVYGVTDRGNIYLINLASGMFGAQLISTMSPRFNGGYQSLMDFNPVVNAIRLIGTSDQNYAVVNTNGGNLNTTAVQTTVAYAQGDVNVGVDPNISGGSYTNNYVGATATIFYGLDFNLGTLITIAPPLTATGSSNTGGGQIQTIGPIVNASGNAINITPIADMDIYTDGNKVNTLIMVSGRKIYTIDLTQINPALPLGQTQKVVANGVALTNDVTSTLIDIAVATPTGAAPAPTPTATPTPTPSPTPTPTATTYQAENAYIGGGGKVDTIHPGYTGTGFVDYADNVANSFVEFTVKQTGTRTLIFRYGNGSTVNRPTSIKVNGNLVGTLTFPPTGSWPTWKTVSIQVNLGDTAGAKVLVTSTINAGGPNLDKMDVQ